MTIVTHRNQGLVLATLSDIRRLLGEEKAKEIELTTPVIKSYAAKCVRVAEIKEKDFSELAVDEDTRIYDMYDIYAQSSNHVLATLAMLKAVNAKLSDLPAESQCIFRNLEATEREKRILRKSVIEIVLQKTKGVNLQ